MDSLECTRWAHHSHRHVPKWLQERTTKQIGIGEDNQSIIRHPLISHFFLAFGLKCLKFSDSVTSNAYINVNEAHVGPANVTHITVATKTIRQRAGMEHEPQIIPLRSRSLRVYSADELTFRKTSLKMGGPLLVVDVLMDPGFRLRPELQSSKTSGRIICCERESEC